VKTPLQSSGLPSSGPGKADTTNALDWARESGESERVIRELEVFLARRRRRRLRLGATSLAALALGLAAWPALHSRLSPAHEPETVATRAVVIRPETRELPDGSRVELNRDADLVVDFSGALRRVTLRRGEAHFEVAKDPQRTFVVVAGGVEVRAVGTAFSVGVAPEAIEVLVTEGQVAVENVVPAAPVAREGGVVAGPAPVFGAGNRIRVDVSAAVAPAGGAQASMVSDEEIRRQLAWRVPRLEFSGTALAQALPMFNAHGGARLVLADPSLGRLQLSGVLRANDIESLLRLLEGEFGIVTERRGGELILRRR